MAGQANRKPAAEKEPHEFLPLPRAAVEKSVHTLTVIRANGVAESINVILRPGDVATFDGETLAEG